LHVDVSLGNTQSAPPNEQDIEIRDQSD
jgi:hypothetical protein